MGVFLLRPPVAGLLARRAPQLTRRSSSKASDPLSILFCGSDEISCRSLAALHDEHRANRRLVESIAVVTRPDKRTGRGLKNIRQSPLKTLAASLGLPVYELDTFRGWTLPAGAPVNIIIAVSFGLFIPGRLLGAARYGGLNIHPSLLPDLRGAAPIQHALLAGRTHTGVTLQTLDDRAFDAGAVLAQTPAVPIGPDATVAGLSSALAAAGADLLVRGLRAGLHVPPLLPVSSGSSSGDIIAAPKITKADLEVPWRCDDPAVSAARLVRHAAVLGPLWTHIAAPDGETRRLILGRLAAVPCPPALWQVVRRALRRRHFGGEESPAETQDVWAVTMMQEEARTGDGPPQTAPVVMPYVVSDDGGGIVVPVRMPYAVESSLRDIVPSPGAAAAGLDPPCLHIGSVKLAGGTWQNAASALAAFSGRIDDGRAGAAGESIDLALDSIAVERRA